MPITKTRRRSTALAALGLAVAAGVTGLGPGGASASSHREAPFIATDPAVDNTDLYAFVNRDRPGYVNLVANFIPFEEPNGGPNFYPFATDATYNIKVDSDGDAKPDATFRWTFHNVDSRAGVDAGLQEAARPGDDHAARWLEDVRRPGRRPVLPRPAGLRPAVRRQP